MDLELGAYWLNLAAEQGSVTAEKYLAMLYEQRVLGPADEATILKLWKSAAEKGNAAAAYKYGSTLVLNGSKSEREEGLEWVYFAAGKQNFYALMFLEGMYTNGLYGAQKDTALGKVFLDLCRPSEL